MNYEYAQPLRFPLNAFAPHISDTTMDKHYNAHYMGYAKNLTILLEGDHSTELAEVVREAAKKRSNREIKIHNNAGQLFNHNEFWECLAPGGEMPTGDLLESINACFGSMSNMIDQVIAIGMGQFASGWIWLVSDKGGNLEIRATSNADSPITDASVTILACIDVWEHAYYLDYQQDRASYIRNVVTNLWNWEHARARYARCDRQDFE